MVLGGHGDSMVPVPAYSTVNGIPITQVMGADRIEAINDRTRNGGAEIVKFLKTGSAYYAPSSSAVAMVEAVLLDSNRVVPACARLTGQYGLDDIYCGVPVQLGRNGVTKVLEIELNQSDLAALKKSSDDVRQVIEKLSVASPN